MSHTTIVIREHSSIIIRVIMWKNKILPSAVSVYVRISSTYIRSLRSNNKILIVQVYVFSSNTSELFSLPKINDDGRFGSATSSPYIRICCWIFGFISHYTCAYVVSWSPSKNIFSRVRWCLEYVTLSGDGREAELYESSIFENWKIFKLKIEKWYEGRNSN